MPKKRKKRRMRKRRWFTTTELVEIWDRWQRGESTKAIGRVLDRGGTSIHRQLAVYGGIRPRPRCRSSRALTLIEREEISRGIAAKKSIRSMAMALGRSPSTLSREIGRNGGYDNYRALEADQRGVGQGTPSEAMPPGPMSPATAAGRRQAPPGLVASTDSPGG